MYIVTPEQAETLQDAIPEDFRGRYLVVHDDPSGYLVHEQADPTVWELDMDAVAASAGWADYAAMLATLTPLDDKRVKLARYIDLDNPYVPPLNVDWRTARKGGVALSKQAVSYGSKGEVLEWRWFPSVGGVTDKTDPVIIERHSMNWTPLGASHRDEVISWVLEDGTEHPTTKPNPKPYDTLEKVSMEGSKRRGFLLKRVLGTVYMTVGHDQAMLLGAQALGNALSTEQTAFVDRNDPSILAAVTALTSVEHPILDVVIPAQLAGPDLGDVAVKAFILARLNIFGA